MVDRIDIPTHLIEHEIISGDTRLKIRGIKQNTKDFFNGTFRETFNFLATSNGTVVTGTITNASGGDLTMQFSDGEHTLDISGNGTCVLVEGSDTAPKSNYIYIPVSTKLLTCSITGFPTDVEHIKVAYLLLASANYVQDDGAYINQNWNDPLSDNIKNQGHLPDITERLRRNGALWFSGVGPNGTDDSAGSSYFDFVSGNEAYFKSTSGVIYQLHRHTYPAKDSRIGSDDIHVVNERAVVDGGNGNFWAIHNLTDIDEDTTGSTFNNRFFNLTFFGVANKAGEYGPIMCNLPTGSYANQSNAEGDVDGFDVLTMPREFSLESGTGFLICRMTFKITGGNWSHKSTVDLRGQSPATATGGASGFTTEFADNQFTVFDEADITKILNLDVGTNVTTGNTRTLAIPNADGVIFLENGAVPMTGNLDMGTNNIINAGTINSGNITIFDVTPILVFKDSNNTGAASIGFIEWRDSANTRLGFLGNSTNQNDDLLWKNEFSGGHIVIQTTGAGEFQIFANVDLNSNNLTTTGTGTFGTPLTIGDGVTDEDIILSFAPSGNAGILKYRFSDDTLEFNLDEDHMGNVLFQNGVVRFADTISVDSAIDFGTNTIIDGEMQGNWDFSGGNFTGMGNITGSDVDLSLGTGTITTTGMATIGRLVSVFTDDSFITRTSTITTGFRQSLTLVHKTTGNALDGFGSGLRFSFTDSGVTEKELGRISVVRDGSDNDGKFIVELRSSDFRVNVFTVDEDGDAFVLGIMDADSYTEHSVVLDKQGKTALSYFTTTSEERILEDGSYDHENIDDELIKVLVPFKEAIEEEIEDGEIVKEAQPAVPEHYTKSISMLVELQRDAILELKQEVASINEQIKINL